MYVLLHKQVAPSIINHQG